MKKYIETHCDGSTTEWWIDKYDDCQYGYECSKYTFQEAIDKFFYDIQLRHAQNNCKTAIVFNQN